ncbi:Uncharacterised protein [Mycobacteroides abscessus subsp. abscessus]|nr:Uncharacterised protein [Mycobacteroides abscessus subsp. abscessus]
MNTSRTVLMDRSGSWDSSSGAVVLREFAFFWISSHCTRSRLMSWARSSSLAPSAAVRTMTPAPSGRWSLRIFFSRARSVSGSFREIPVMDPPGT